MVTTSTPAQATLHGARDALRTVLEQLTATRVESAYVEGVIAGLDFALGLRCGDESQSTEPRHP